MKYFKHLPVIALCSLVQFAYANKTPQAQNLKPRIVVLTDIAPNEIEPDDMESMVRLLVHADLYEIEALIATTGWSNNGGNERIDLIHTALNAYEKDLPNLQKRSLQSNFFKDETMQEIGYWPSVDYLRSRTVTGSKKMGTRFIGSDNNSAGSDLIIKLADEQDERPIWVTVWGGGNTFAQAVWRVQHERSPEQLKTFLHKFRVYTITDQDRPWSQGDTIAYAGSTHQWLRSFNQDLMFFWDECAWKHQNATGVSNWNEYATHIQQHGNLGALYPKFKWGVEGDTPSFMHLASNGLSNPEQPTQVSWSGYFEYSLGRDSLTHAFNNYTGKPYEICTKYFNYFYPAIFNNFAARMDWAKQGKGNRNPVVIVNGNKGIQSITLECIPGADIQFNASGSSDPDGDKLSFKWWVIPEAGNYTGIVNIANNETSIATIRVPQNAAGKTFHVICEVTDNGTPRLTSYRRIIFDAK